MTCVVVYMCWIAGTRDVSDERRPSPLLLILPSYLNVGLPYHPFFYSTQLNSALLLYYLPKPIERNTFRRDIVNQETNERHHLLATATLFPLPTITSLRFLTLSFSLAQPSSSHNKNSSSTKLLFSKQNFFSFLSIKKKIYLKTS